MVLALMVIVTFPQKTTKQNEYGNELKVQYWLLIIITFTVRKGTGKLPELVPNPF
jgi:hypothetical protein